MRPSKLKQRKTEKAVAGLKDFLIAMGKDPDEVDKAFDNAPLLEDEKILQAEGVLLHLLKPSRFLSKKCIRPECGQIFGTSYRSVAYCSNACRARHLESQTGIRWNPHTDRYQNLGAEPPLVIGPEAHSALVQFARCILEQTQILTGLPEPALDLQIPEPQVLVLPPVENEQDHQWKVGPLTTPETLPQQLEPPSQQDPDDPFGF